VIYFIKQYIDTEIVNIFISAISNSYEDTLPNVCITLNCTTNYLHRYNGVIVKQFLSYTKSLAS